MLREQTDTQPIVDKSIPINQVQITSQRFDKSRLSSTIGSDQCNPSLKVNVNVNPSKDDAWFTVTKRSFIQTAEWWRKFLRVWEHEHTGWVLKYVSN